MSSHALLAFALASALLGLVPGPGVLSIVGYAVASGRRVALASVGGMVVGNALAMTLSLVGVGALLVGFRYGDVSNELTHRLRSMRRAHPTHMHQPHDKLIGMRYWENQILFKSTLSE